MSPSKRQQKPFSGTLTSLFGILLLACGSTGNTDSTSNGGATNSGSGGQSGLPNGAECTLSTSCASGSCVGGKCVVSNVGSGGGSNANSGGVPGVGSGGKLGGSSGAPQGNSGSGGTSSVPSTTTTGPHFTGSGQSFRPLTVGCGPETADQCTGTCEQKGGAPDTTVIRPPATLCFKGAGDGTPDDPSAVIEQVIERSGGKTYVHIRVTFDPSFTDNSYGEGSCCGWPPKRGHTFTDLIKSDHTELLLTDATGATVMNFKIDLATADASSPCGYGTLGVMGGDGAVITGDASAVLAVSTSLDRNLNGCGYCKSAACASSGDCTIDSPTTDSRYTPNPLTPNWDYRQVYEVWIDISAFGNAGFGQAYITYTHSSPAKTTDTIQVEPTPCPPVWDKPYCPPGQAGCFGTGGSGGTSSSGGAGGGGGTTSGGGTAGNMGTGGSTGGTCPPNYQLYLATEGAATCTPIPFANYPDHAPCPMGYVLDTASEGQYCLPAK
ncbi:MAG: hypothetical protein ACOY0T_33870 [Myxococcota bacterium]